MNRTIVIVGAGVTGLSAAYHLARAGGGRVILLDKNHIGDGSSSRAAAIITGHLWSETGVNVRKLALQRYRELGDELEGYRFNEVGCLNLFDAISWRERQPLLDLYRRLGAPFDVLTAAEVQRRWPQVQLPNETIALHDPMGGYSEPDQYLAALARRCADLSVEIRTDVTVTGLLRSTSGDVRGVQTARGEIAADIVIACAFAWTNLWLADAGLLLPVKSFVHQRFTTTPAPQPFTLPAINANFLGGYVRPTTANRLLLGIETPQREEWRVDSLEFRMSMLTIDGTLAHVAHDRFAAIIPALRPLTVEPQHHVGLITFSADHEPIVGAVRAIPGLLVAAGFHSGGFAYNPAIGHLLAESITRGVPSINIDAYSPDRLERDVVDADLGDTMRASDMATRRH